MGSRLFEVLLKSRGFTDSNVRQSFLNPSYDATRYNPFLLPDMKAAVDRIIEAKQKNEQVYIYGDYDIDGLTATSILLEALGRFGLRVKAFIPNRFVEGYGLSKSAIKALAETGTQLIITVDCGSLSHAEIEFANDLGVEVIVTDHHSVAEMMPPAVATINPKRVDHQYPFIDLAGCGVAFKLVQALQQKLDGLPDGQEKWLLDLVALGTVCDVVSLQDENRANVHWGLKVMTKTKRPGIRALASVAKLDLNTVTARSLGFVLGPHLNAAGRLETAQLSLDLLTTKDPMEALDIAYKLHELNHSRKVEQERITKEAAALAAQFAADPVLVLSHPSWSHGIIGIVAAKMLETFQKPTFVLQEIGEESKGSARSYGDFSAVEGIRAVNKWLTKGGGHKLAAGVTLPSEHIADFRKAINEFYHSLNLTDQLRYLEPIAEVVVDDLRELTLEFITELKQFEPYGHGNTEPIFHLRSARVLERKTMGGNNQHLKLHVVDRNEQRFAMVGFNQAKRITAGVGDMVDIWFHLLENEWRGMRSAEGRLLKVASSEV